MKCVLTCLRNTSMLDIMLMGMSHHTKMSSCVFAKLCMSHHTKCVLSCLRNTSILVDKTLTCANLTTLSWNERSFQNELAKFKDVAMPMTRVIPVPMFAKHDMFTSQIVCQHSVGAQNEPSFCADLRSRNRKSFQDRW